MIYPVAFDPARASGVIHPLNIRILLLLLGLYLVPAGWAQMRGSPLKANTVTEPVTCPDIGS